MRHVYRAGLIVASACALVLVGSLVSGDSSLAAPAAVGCFVSLGIGAFGFRRLREFSFTIWIFAAVTAAMFYPQYFQKVGDFDLKVLIVPLIQVIMFGMGTRMSLKDFGAVAKTPKGVLVGLVCQFTIMPLVGVSLALAFRFPAEIAAGVVLIGCAPSGVASNVMAYIAGANLALSITLTAIATLLAPIVTPALMELLAGQFVPIDFVDMMIGIVEMVIVPIVLGLILNRLTRGRAAWLDKAMPLLSMVGIAVIITIITAAGRDALLDVGLLLVLAAVIHNGTGYLLGYWSARLLRMDKKSCRTIAIEVGMQNGGLASGIALQMGKVATVGLAPAIFGPWMNISGSALANWWRRTSEEKSEIRNQKSERKIDLIE
ncbi:MAG TPA: bile acid:sodium symporter family protein [Rhodothermales bacterium]|nr:bile acid:sodium symporter family protein [Rhodothermales bacterium]